MQKHPWYSEQKRGVLFSFYLHCVRYGSLFRFFPFFSFFNSRFGLYELFNYNYNENISKRCKFTVALKLFKRMKKTHLNAFDIN